MTNHPTIDPQELVAVFFRAGARPPAAAAQFQSLLEDIPGIGEKLRIENPGELLSQVQAAPQAVVVLCVGNKDELLEVVGLIQSLQNKARDGKLRILVFNSLEIAKVHTLLVSRGSHDVLAYSLSRQGLIKKIHYNVMLLKNTKQRPQAARTSAPESQSVAKEAPIVFGPPIETESDCWLMRKIHVKSVIGTWLIELTGPSPAAGAWKSADPDSTEEERLWVWHPSAGSAQALLPEPGQWQLVAKQPEFIWKVNRYKIVGKKLELRFLRESGEIFWRFRTGSDGKITVAENSESAKSKITLIESTFDSSIVIRQDQKKGSEDFVMKDESVTRAWGQGDLSKDEEESRPDFKESRGRAAAQDFVSPAEAFASLQVTAMLYPEMDSSRPGVEAEVIEQSVSSLVLEVPTTFARTSSSILADLISKGKTTRTLRLELRADSEEPIDSSRKLIFATIVGGGGKHLDSMVSEFVQRQQDILLFLAEAKGF